MILITENQFQIVIPLILLIPPHMEITGGAAPDSFQTIVDTVVSYRSCHLQIPLRIEGWHPGATRTHR
jgi:hypothetical protein